MITIIEEWVTIDKWWTEKPERRSYAEVIWDGRLLTFKRELPDKVWRIVRAK